MVTDMELLRNHVAAMRREHTNVQSRLKDLRQEYLRKFAADYDYLLERQEELAEELKEGETELRELAVQAYETTGNKQPAEGICIRVMKRLDYLPEAARDWCIDRGFASCLTIEKKAFESLARTGTPELEGVVTITEEPQATIARELSKEAVPV